jgi:hypothetical protein
MWYKVGRTKGEKIMNAMTIQVIIMSLLFVGILALFVKGGFFEDMKLWWGILWGKDEGEHCVSPDPRTDA